jgi:uncharacterized protein (TIGR00156 family)
MLASIKKTVIMRKSLSIIILLFAVTTVSKAQFVGSGDVLTVQEVKDQQNDGNVVMLEGYIVKSLGDEHYLFQDDTGEIQVEIEDEVWQGQEVNRDTKVRIEGVVDEDLTSVNIEVSKIEITSKSKSSGWNS